MPPIEQIVHTGPNYYVLIIINAWWALAFTHWVTDYGLQTKWVAENKHHSPLAMLAHVGINGAGVMLMTFSVTLGVVEMYLHWRIERAYFSPGHDQVTHILSKVLIVLAWYHLWPKG